MQTPENLPDAFSLEGRVALVTGASRGIGRAILLGLAAVGADVVVHDLANDESMQSVVAAARELGVRADHVSGDLGLPGGGRTLAGRVLERVGGADIVVINAAVQIRQPWLEISPVEFEMQMRTNFQASLEILQVLAPQMREKKWGRILTVGSVQQVRPHPEMLVYAAMKAAQMNMILNLAKQLAGDGISANNLAPGVVFTDRNSEVLSDAAFAEKVRASIPVGYFGEPDDMVGAALLLCSEAGRYITGQNLQIDGGLSLP